MLKKHLEMSNIQINANDHDQWVEKAKQTSMDMLRWG